MKNIKKNTKYLKTIVVYIITNQMATSSIKYLKKLSKYLDTHFHGCVLMPTREGGKIPLYKHANGAYTVDMFNQYGIYECNHGCEIILSNELIVIDIDDMEYCNQMETMFCEFKETVCCQTQKGRHYYFKRSDVCDTIGLTDGARQMKDDIPIDIKTKTAKGTGGVISIPPSPNKKWINELGDSQVYLIPDSFIHFFNENRKNTQIKSKTTKCRNNCNASNIIVKTIHPSKNNDEVKSLLQLLNKSRNNNYDEWIRLGWCLHNISIENLYLWIKFSKGCPNKYVEGECDKLWTKMKDEGLHIGTLHMWAKQDNPLEYKAWLNTDIFNEIKNCNGSHNSIASIVYKLLKDRFVCASAKGKLWYEFNGSLWVEDIEGIRLRKEISSSIKEQFIITVQSISQNTQETQQQEQQLCDRLQSLAYKLEDRCFKDNIVMEMREYFYDRNFLKNLDSNPSLIAFTNGVWSLPEGRFRLTKPEDLVSLSVKYPYCEDKDEFLYKQVHTYFLKLHPHPEQRNYIIKTFARQLYGDNGMELFHVHAGCQGSASNGKSKFFEVLENCLGDYIRKFNVSILTSKQRLEPSKPMPEFNSWKGVRFLYCSEPNVDEHLHSGIMKEFTGGEKFVYRMLFANEMCEFRPQFKMHIMCNNTPLIEGSDDGVCRRIRLNEYISIFVQDEKLVDENKNFFLADVHFIERFRTDNKLKMEMMRYLLDNYNHMYRYEMPDIIKESSKQYLEENNNILKFVQEYIAQGSPSEFISLKTIKQAFTESQYFSKNALITMKKDLQKILRVPCIEQKKINNVKYRSIFMGYKIVNETFIDETIDNLEL